MASLKTKKSKKHLVFAPVYGSFNGLTPDQKEAFSICSSFLGFSMA